ncbi:hypothetical protein LIER_32004 [Lithospermum erythrorhizon]|uniref:Uncharacterized protein n=1 Tax=Lithospermum erythrorhizon TaxID=34254 RepID=A0AAV3RSP0_LITER
MSIFSRIGIAQNLPNNGSKVCKHDVSQHKVLTSVRTSLIESKSSICASNSSMVLQHSTLDFSIDLEMVTINENIMDNCSIIKRSNRTKRKREWVEERSKEWGKQDLDNLCASVSLGNDKA